MHQMYMCDFNVYTGATGERETGLGEKVVLTLAESMNHQLYFDNYFTSISLLTKLPTGSTILLRSVQRLKDSSVVNLSFISVGML